MNEYMHFTVNTPEDVTGKANNLAEAAGWRLIGVAFAPYKDSLRGEYTAFLERSKP